MSSDSWLPYRVLRIRQAKEILAPRLECAGLVVRNVSILSQEIG
jgi:hypothetical protein